MINFYLETYGNPANQKILFLHGFMGSACDWQEVVTYLKSDFFCITVDLPGHGQTTADDNSDYEMENTSDQLVSFLKKQNLNNLVLCGYSMGGRLAYYLTINYPEIFSHVIIESASPGLQSESERKDRRENDAKLIEKILNQPLKQFVESWYRLPLFQTIDKSSQSYKGMIERRLKNNRQLLAISLKLMGLGQQPSLWEKLPGRKGKLLLIDGELDSKFRKINKAVARNCPSVKIETIENAGHNTHLEQPHKFIETIKLFLK